MSMIRVNLKTKQIEIEGSESFADDFFGKIQDLLIESQGVKETKVVRKERGVAEALMAERDEPEIIGKVKTLELTKASQPGMSAANHKMEPQRPPARKYILRKAGIASTNDSIVNVTKEDAGRISLVSLKEKSGLTEQQIEAIIKDAEKQGRIRKDMDGSYAWV